MNKSRKGLFAMGLVVLVAAALPLLPSGGPDRAVVAFYNLENLFDTLDTPGVLDEEFTPGAQKQWNSERYWLKIERKAEVLKKLSEEAGVEGASVIGLCEMENRTVLEDLVASEDLKDLDYKIIHYDSPDKRGIDVALLYRTDDFVPENSRAVPLLLLNEEGQRVFTRDQLVVSGRLHGSPIHFIVNHWPARSRGRGGEDFREQAARLTRSLSDSILAKDRKARIVIMGDFNDDPTDLSMQHFLGAALERDSLGDSKLFNATAPLFAEGQGSLKYRGQWNLFDQMVVSKGLLKERFRGYYYHSAHIYGPDYLLQQEGDYAGYTWRTYVGNWYHGGYSDHLPVYLILERKR